MNKPSIPKGTRDFSPAETAKRNYIFTIIRSVFDVYGFQQIETPALENLSTLLGKYGDEGDRLLYKVLDSGDFLHGMTAEEMSCMPPAKLASRICEKGLRYDLTVPFARYVVQHRAELIFPFRRYQIQPVWRADRPQKGRYREFRQCDADIVGTSSLLCETELVEMIDDVFDKFGIAVTIKINNRKLLAGIAEMIGAADRLTALTVAIDKLEKVGMDNVNAELLAGGLSAEQVERLQPIFTLAGGNDEKLARMAPELASSETGTKGIEETRYVLDKLKACNLKNEVQLDLTLARGLNYYTGAIFEVKAKDVEIGSISGGGRYDNLTGIFGADGLSGVGVSFGADRIYDVLNQLNLFPDSVSDNTQALFLNLGECEAEYCLPVVRRMRRNGISVEIYPEAAKLKKQMAYANARKIPCVIIAGENEIAAGKLTVKNMSTGEQCLVNRDDAIESRVKEFSFKG